MKEQCERKVGILSDTVSFISMKKAVALPALGLGLYSGIAASALVEKANWFATSGLLSQVCNKFDDGEEHTIDELDYIDIDGLKINDLMGDYERIKSVLIQQDQKDSAKFAQLEAKFEAKFAQVQAELVQVKSELAFVKAELAQNQTSIDKPHIEKTPEFPEISHQFTKLSVQSDGEKSLESQPKIILKSSQTYPRMIRLQRPRSSQSPLARQHQLASLRPNMEHFGRFSRSVPRKSLKIFSKPPKFPRKKPSPRFLKEETFSIHNIKGVKLLVENGQVAHEPEFLPLHLNNGNVMK